MDKQGEIATPTTTRRNILRAGVGALALSVTNRAKDVLQKSTSQPHSSISSSEAYETAADSKATMVYFYLEDPKEISRAIELVEAQKKGSLREYFVNPNHEHVARTLKYKQMIKDVCTNARLSSSVSKEWFEKVMLGLIFTESKGDPNAGDTPSNKGRGLTQLEPGAEADAKIAAGISGNINITDPKTNTTLAVYYLDKLINLYRDPTLALWAYNLGEGNMNDAIVTYAKSQAEKIEDKIVKEKAYVEIEKDFNRIPTPGAPERGTDLLVKKYKMNAINVSESEAVRTMFKNKKYPILSSTYEYVPRIAAATQLLNAV